MRPSAGSDPADAAALDLLVEGLRVMADARRCLLLVERLFVPAGQSVAVRGASGAGKSTLLHALCGLVRPQAGSVRWGEHDLASFSAAGSAAFRRQHVGLIFQDYHLFEELSALGNAGLAASFAPPADREHIRRGAGQWLDRLGLGNTGGRSVASFSGGERQRIAVARALAGDPPIVLADEPTASLDRAAADALADDLAGLGRSGKRTLIAVTHDAALASLLDRQLTIVDGRIVEDSDG